MDMYNGKIVLCGANSYEEKYYLNPDFEQLPDHVKDELKIMCVLYVHDVGGILTLVYEENGDLCFEVTSAEGDAMFDEIGSRLKIKQLQQEKAELLHVIPSSYPVEEALKLSGTRVLMKAGKKMGQVKAQLEALSADVCMIENCGMENEKIYRSAEEIPEDAGYYSLILVKEKAEQ